MSETLTVTQHLHLPVTKRQKDLHNIVLNLEILDINYARTWTKSEIVQRKVIMQKILRLS